VSLFEKLQNPVTMPVLKLPEANLLLKFSS